MFPGKPVNTENGEAFIISQESQGKVFLCFSLKQTLSKYNMQKVVPLKLSGKHRFHFIVLRINDIKEDKDSDCITYDAKQMQEIETNKRVKQSERKKHQGNRCRAFCTSIRGSSLFVGGLVIAQNTQKKSMSPAKSIRRGSFKGSLGKGSCQIF